MNDVITVKNLVKTYKGYKRGAGLKEAVISLFKRKTVYSYAVKNISFSIKEGEIVGFVGPNGAGKSTAIKIMTGVLYPSSGEVHILGFVPWEQRKKYVKHIGAVFGQKSQLWWDLPPIDMFHLSKSIYDIPEKEFRQRLETMIKILKVEEVVHRPTRQLSLGERMKCEFIIALLHNPQVLFLDEPTIGVDAIAKEEIREFLLHINKKYRTTIILTTHDMDDIEELCKRIVIIDQGTIVYDGNLEKIKQYLNCQTVDFEFTAIKDRARFLEIMKKGTVLEDRKWFKSIQFNRNKVNVPEIVSKLMKCCEVVDLTIKEPKLEHIIKEIYNKGMENGVR